LSEALRAWEPRLELYLPPRHARLFEPDGTLYAVALSGPMTVVAGRRQQEIARGDAIIVPQGLALDIEPEVDLLGIRHDGPPPDHFRERFIQVWGFEHLAAEASRRRPDRDVRDVLPSAEVRHRLSYAIVEPRLRPVDLETGLDVDLVIGLVGEPDVVLSENGRVRLGPSHVVAVGPGLSYRLESGADAVVGVLTLSTELVHEARRAEHLSSSRRSPSPEYDPEPGGDGPRAGLNPPGGGAGSGHAGPA
jgi:hypothetical protein